MFTIAHRVLLFFSSFLLSLLHTHMRTPAHTPLSTTYTAWPCHLKGASQADVLLLLAQRTQVNDGRKNREIKETNLSLFFFCYTVDFSQQRSELGVLWEKKSWFILTSVSLIQFSKHSYLPSLMLMTEEEINNFINYPGPYSQNILGISVAPSDITLRKILYT